uniref:Uncharacterized protein n=1 Tax=Acrobeloides nanus TaxID=290746 RepID=A0A914EAG0_9BILA
MPIDGSITNIKRLYNHAIPENEELFGDGIIEKVEHMEYVILSDTVNIGDNENQYYFDDGDDDDFTRYSDTDEEEPSTSYA